MGKKADTYVSGFNLGVSASCTNPCKGQEQKKRRRDLSLPFTGLGDAPILGLERRVIEDQYDTTTAGNGYDADRSWGPLLFLLRPDSLTGHH